MALLPVSLRLVFCLFAWVSIAAAQETSPLSFGTMIDDDAIVHRIETLGTAMVRTGKCKKFKTLRAQLQRSTPCGLQLPSSTQESFTPPELYQHKAEGVLIVGMLVKMKKSERYELAACSGFALTADGIFVTNYHVIDNPLANAVVVMGRDGRIFPVTEVLAADKLSDVAIVRAEGATFKPLTLSASVPPTGSPVWVISHPDHNFFSLTAGIISRHFITDTEIGRTPEMAITADFGVGSSGGPIFDAQGEVIGMVCSTTSIYWEDAKHKINDLQMVLKHCVPVESIRRLVAAP